jgi:hypothetical protein
LASIVLVDRFIDPVIRVREDFGTVVRQLFISTLIAAVGDEYPTSIVLRICGFSRPAVAFSQIATRHTALLMTR